MTVEIVKDGAQTGWLKIKILGNAVAAGLVGEVANPEGVLLQITDGFEYIKTGALAASTFNIGIGASGADENDLVSAFAQNQADGTCWKVVDLDTASEAAFTGAQNGGLWSATDYLTVTSAAQVSTGLEAYLFLQYVRLA